MHTISYFIIIISFLIGIFIGVNDQHLLIATNDIDVNAVVFTVPVSDLQDEEARYEALRMIRTTSRTGRPTLTEKRRVNRQWHCFHEFDNGHNQWLETHSDSWLNYFTRPGAGQINQFRPNVDFWLQNNTSVDPDEVDYPCILIGITNQPILNGAILIGPPPTNNERCPDGIDGRTGIRTNIPDRVVRPDPEPNQPDSEPDQNDSDSEQDQNESEPEAEREEEDDDMYFFYYYTLNKTKPILW